jgi:hypothetical protein
VENIFVPIIVAMIGSGSTAALATALVNRLSKGDPVKVGLRLLLQDKIERIGTKALNDGQITYEQKHLLNAMHTCYHIGLHGNGDENALMADVNELPVIYPNRKKNGE